MSYRWWSCCRSDTGRQRSINEDAYLDQDKLGLWVVADGMGGHARGDVASRLIVEALDGLPRPDSIEAFSHTVKERLRSVNRRMWEQSFGGLTRQIMGSTVVAFLVYKREWSCLWAGDSRAYLMRNGRLFQITRDHSLAQEMADQGNIPQKEVALHPMSNRITRAIGACDELVLDEYRSSLVDGDTVLLCSDGLNKEVDDAELADILETFDCEEASRELVDLTLERGARDNVTVAVIHFEATTGFRDRFDDDTAVNRAVHQARASFSDSGHRPAAGVMRYRSQG